VEVDWSKAAASRTCHAVSGGCGWLRRTFSIGWKC